MDILYQCDDNYAPFTGVSLYSLLENNKDLDTIRIFVINDSISPRNQELMRNCVTSYGRILIFIDAKEITDATGSNIIRSYKGTRKNTNSFLKILAIDLLPDDVEKILYLDSDTLVLNSLSKLEKINLNGHLMAMVMDSLVDKSKQLIGFARSDPYYNSGVIYIDVDLWKKQQCGARAIQHAMTHSYGTVDQDLLNVEFKDTVLTLPPKFNFQPHHLHYRDKDYFAVISHKNGNYYSPTEISTSRDSICIMHFFRYLGTQPWHANNLHPCSPMFDRYLDLSPWRDYKKESISPGTMFNIEIALYKILPDRVFLRLFMVFFLIKLKVS